MNLKLPTSIAFSSLLVFALVASAAAQQKRQTPVKTPAPPAAAPAPPPPPPTFDTLLATDTYKIYGEVRSVGQFIKSTSVNEILEPILTLAGPPQEFRTVVKWLNRHADEVMSSRMLVAGGPSPGRDLPEILIAIEFASAEDAAKFHVKLNGFLKVMLPTPTPDPAAEKKKNEQPPQPPYHMQQAGSLILITPRPLNLRKLRPAGSKLLSEDANFRVAHNRFSTESIFVFVNVAEIEKEDQERTKRYEQPEKTLTTEIAANPDAAAPPKVELVTEPDKSDEPAEVELKVGPEKTTIVGVQSDLGAGQPQDESQAKQTQEILMALTMVMSGLSRVEAKMPDAVGVAVSLEDDSFDVRALLINAPGEKSDPIPFFPILSPGPAIVPEAPNILPADTETLVTMSLDLQQIYTALSKPEPTPTGTQFKPASGGANSVSEPFTVMLERHLKVNIKDELLPLLGSEIVISVPTTGVDWFQPPKVEPASSSSGQSSKPSPDTTPSASPNANPNTPDQSQGGPSIVIGLSLKDKEGMRTLLPKLIESLAFKGASSFAQTERREDTELVSYANIISYAFIGNFLVISPDAATTRHVVDSYLKHQTLSGDPHFKNYTRWQPRQVQGQIYISPTLMESYRKYVNEPTARLDDQTRAFLTRFSIVAQPVTYSLSNEGFGPLHELHVPKNLVLLLVAATSGALNTPPPDDDTPDKPASPPPTKPANPF